MKKRLALLGLLALGAIGLSACAADQKSSSLEEDSLSSSDTGELTDSGDSSGTDGSSDAGESSSSSEEPPAGDTSSSTPTEDVDIWDPDLRGEPYSIASDPELSAYYSSVDWSLGGVDLLRSLDDCLDDHCTWVPSYSEAKTILQKADAYPGRSGYVYGFYTGKPTNSWNREHVWPKSRLGSTNSNQGADPHMLRPCDSSVNSSRGNYYYGESGQWTYDPAEEGVEEYRGNAARIIFYEAVRWEEAGLVLDDKPRSQSDHDNPESMGKITDLLKWNMEYGLMEDEEPRNEYIADQIGVRNPFIDAPEIANRIYAEWL